jgi:lysophospholipase L1-like esterase
MLRLVTALTLLFVLSSVAAQEPLPAEEDDPDNIVLWGDSLAAGAGGEGITLSTVATSIFNEERAVLNMGIGGQTSTSIAARMNAIPTVLSVSGAALPPAGPVVVTQRSVTPITDQGDNVFEGTLCGISGMLAASRDDQGVYHYSFERSTSGAIVPCPDGSIFEFAIPDLLRGRTAWLWLGRNGADPGRTVIADVAEAVESLGHDRYLVGGIITGAADGNAGVAYIKNLNQQLASIYGERFVDLQAELFQWAASEEDNADVSKGITPRSQRNDDLHLNAAGYFNVAWAFAQKTIALGF